MVDDWVIKTMYATKRRRKNPKSIKPTSLSDSLRHDQSGKSNPSKRHRERLNSELEHLASLLPFEQNVIVKLDKLSILRLAVSYLRMKCYFQSLSCDRLLSENRLVSHLYHCPYDFTRVEGEACLQAMNGFIFIMSCDGEVFTVSKTVEHYLGFHQADILHQSVLELIHSEDREEFRKQLSWRTYLPPELHSCSVNDLMTSDLVHYLKRRFTVRFRCLLDNTSGFITLELSGRLHYLYGQTRGVGGTMISSLDAPGKNLIAQVAASSSSSTANHVHSHYNGHYYNQLYSSFPPLGLFVVCSPLGPLLSLSGAQRDATFKTKHQLDLSLISADSRTKTLLNYMDSDLQNIKAYDLLHPQDLRYVAQGHREVFKTGSIGLLVHRWLSKTGDWIWLQSRLKLMTKSGKPDHVIAIHRQLTYQEGMELLNRRTDEYKLPFPLLEPETLLSDDDCGVAMHGPTVKPGGLVFQDQLTTSDTTNAAQELFGGLLFSSTSFKRATTTNSSPMKVCRPDETVSARHFLAGGMKNGDAVDNGLFPAQPTSPGLQEFLSRPVSTRATLQHTTNTTKPRSKAPRRKTIADNKMVATHAWPDSNQGSAPHTNMIASPLFSNILTDEQNSSRAKHSDVSRDPHASAECLTSFGAYANGGGVRLNVSTAVLPKDYYLGWRQPVTTNQMFTNYETSFSSCLTTSGSQWADSLPVMEGVNKVSEMSQRVGESAFIYRQAVPGISNSSTAYHAYSAAVAAAAVVAAANHVTLSPVKQTNTTGEFTDPGWYYSLPSLTDTGFDSGLTSSQPFNRGFPLTYGNDLSMLADRFRLKPCSKETGPFTSESPTLYNLRDATQTNYVKTVSNRLLQYAELPKLSNMSSVGQALLPGAFSPTSIPVVDTKLPGSLEALQYSSESMSGIPNQMMPSSPDPSVCRSRVPSSQLFPNYQMHAPYTPSPSQLDAKRLEASKPDEENEMAAQSNASHPCYPTTMSRGPWMGPRLANHPYNFPERLAFQLENRSTSPASSSTSSSESPTSDSSKPTALSSPSSCSRPTLVTTTVEATTRIGLLEPLVGQRACLPQPKCASSLNWSIAAEPRLLGQSQLGVLHQGLLSQHDNDDHDDDDTGEKMTLDATSQDCSHMGTRTGGNPVNIAQHLGVIRPNKYQYCASVEAYQIS